MGLSVLSYATAMHATYTPKLLDTIQACPAADWNALLDADETQAGRVFVRHEFLAALEDTHCVGEKTGWIPQHLTLWRNDADNHSPTLVAACPLYLKLHSYGEYVFDWAWAEAYQRHGLDYYPKLLCAIPFTPVRGPRLLARDAEARQALLETLLSVARQNQVSSLHLLFPPNTQTSFLREAGLLMRDSVQFHWRNQGYRHFEDFLQALTKKKRKNIRQERRHAAELGLRYEHIPGRQATPQDWEVFYECYARTYYEHRSQPYLNAAFFQRWAQQLPDNLHLIFASRETAQGMARIAAVLLVVDRTASEPTAYGRYWGALEHHPFLHFEMAYYQSLEYCIAHGIQRFEGGAQGEHKLARGFLPEPLHSAHWLAQAEFSEAVAEFLAREHQGMQYYLDELNERAPLKVNT